MLVVVAGLEINATLRKLVALVVLAAAVKVETTLLVRPIKESLELQTPEVGVAVERITVLPYKQAVPAALVLSSSNTKFRLAPRSLPSNLQPSG
jgi:DNA polymerase III psi subunit